MDRWRNKVAIVTGASVGIGAAISEKLVNEEIIVVGLARRKDKLEELSKKLNNDKQLFYPYVADVTKEEGILNAIKWASETLGPIHILVNNAGIVRIANLTEGETHQWREVFNTNVIGLCIATREAIKNMKENNIDGHIIHMNSIAGHKSTVECQIYGPSKHAVTALTEILRLELLTQTSKIKVTSISPGAVKTDIYLTAVAQGKISSGFSEEDFSKLNMLQPEDVANSVLYVLGTPPHVQIHELMIQPVGEYF